MPTLLMTSSKYLRRLRPASTRMGRTFDPKMAWWFLSRAQKRELQELRKAGDPTVGGDPLKRPLYWWLQNKGMPKVGIEGYHYVDYIVAQTDGAFDYMARQFIEDELGAGVITREVYG